MKAKSSFEKVSHMANVLFLLKPGFVDSAVGSGAFYCPGCATIRGLLEYFPQLRDHLDVQEVDFPRPRPAVAARLGQEHPGCPVLVLDASENLPEGIEVRTAVTGLRFLSGANEIGSYLAAKYGTATPHP
jgi:Protein of unknown function (DUF3088)